MNLTLLHSTDEEVDNFLELIQAVNAIGDWRGLCMNLQVTEGVINRLEHSRIHDEDKKRDCLQAYFDTGEANWTEVVRAVMMSPIANMRIAKQIAKNHGVNYNKVKDEL